MRSMKKSVKSCKGPHFNELETVVSKYTTAKDYDDMRKL